MVLGCRGAGWPKGIVGEFGLDIEGFPEFLYTCSPLEVPMYVGHAH